MKIFLMAVIFCTIYSCKQQVIETAPDIVRVKVSKVSFEEMSFPIHSSGIIVSAKEIKLSFKTGGIIATLYADDGARVKKGELLASLNLSEIEAQVAQVKNGYEKAVRDYNRAKNLFEDSVATLEQLQNAETVLNVAKANLEIATFNKSHSAIYAPENGVILKRLAESNEMIAPGYPVFILGMSGKQWKIRAGLADRDFVRIMPGDSARFTLDAYPGASFRAVVSQVGESANAFTGTYEIELEIQPVKQRLASGFVANLEIFPAQVVSYFRIPVEAIVEAEGKSGFVYAVTDSSVAKKVRVTIAGIFDKSAAVSGGLSDVKEVVTEGAAYIADGEHVTIIR